MTVTSLPTPKRVANKEALQAIRLAMGYNISEFARFVGLSPSYMSRIESGDAAGSPRALKVIADALGVSIFAISIPKPRRDTG